MVGPRRLPAGRGGDPAVRAVGARRPGRGGGRSWPRWPWSTPRAVAGRLALDLPLVVLAVVYALAGQRTARRGAGPVAVRAGPAGRAGHAGQGHDRHRGRERPRRLDVGARRRSRAWPGSACPRGSATSWRCRCASSRCCGPTWPGSAGRWRCGPRSTRRTVALAAGAPLARRAVRPRRPSGPTRLRLAADLRGGAAATAARSAGRPRPPTPARPGPPPGWGARAWCRRPPPRLAAVVLR